MTDDEFQKTYGSVSAIAGVHLDPEIADEVMDLRDSYEEYSNQQLEAAENERSTSRPLTMASPNRARPSRPLKMRRPPMRIWRLPSPGPQALHPRARLNSDRPSAM